MVMHASHAALALNMDAPAVSRFRMATSPRSAAAERRRREQELRQALASGELALSFAGRQSLASGAIGAAEAVIRWPQRRRGPMPAAAFAPLVERSALAGEIGAWLLLAACTAAANWVGDAVVSVDIAGIQAVQDGLLDQVAAALAGSGLPPDRLEIEMNEVDLVGGLDEHLLRLAALRDLGVGVALDGFGAGAASLTLLRRLPLTTLKLDSCLVKEVAVSREDRAILQAIIHAAHTIGLLTVATGIETDEQCAMLTSMACDAGQGPLFGPNFSSDWPGEPVRSS